jgi:hypothetical protein
MKNFIFGDFQLPFHKYRKRNGSNYDSKSENAKTIGHF